MVSVSKAPVPIWNCARPSLSRLAVLFLPFLPLAENRYTVVIVTVPLQ